MRARRRKRKKSLKQKAKVGYLWTLTWDVSCLSGNLALFLISMSTSPAFLPCSDQNHCSLSLCCTNPQKAHRWPGWPCLWAQEVIKHVYYVLILFPAVECQEATFSKISNGFSTAEIYEAREGSLVVYGLTLPPGLSGQNCIWPINIPSMNTQSVFF